MHVAKLLSWHLPLWGPVGEGLLRSMLQSTKYYLKNRRKSIEKKKKVTYFNLCFWLLVFKNVY